MPDTTPPSAPVIVVATVSGTRLNVSWPPASDNIAVTKYEVRRNGVLVGTVTTPGYLDTGLSGGHTYTYVVTAFDAANNSTASAPIVGMTAWWPDGYDNPAFRTRRSTYGPVTGGDYTRGSGISTLPHTALRNPTQTIDLAAAVTGINKGLLFCRPYANGDPAVDYQTIEIIWGWPSSIELSWEEVSLVRSSYGAPSTPSEGETVFRAKRGNLAQASDGRVFGPIIHDGTLPGGRWYYYTLFFRITVDWVAYMSDGCLLPADYGHKGHLWDGVPPFYQWTDDNYRVDDGFLRQFLNIFGFYMDNTRGFVESVLELHHIDMTPMLLLKHLGANYGHPYEAGLGDIRYRAFIANISNLHQTRGTAVGLQDLVETASKYQCDVVGGSNTMLLNDDSDFFTGTGNWVPVHPNTNAALTTVTWTEVKMVNSTSIPTPTGASGARGVMRVDTQQSVQAQNILITCGDGIHRDLGPPVVDREVIPLYGGVPVDVGRTFAFSIWCKSEKAGETATPYLMWFDASGQPTGLLSKQAGTPVVLDLNWNLLQASAAVPANAVYLIPAVYLSTRQTGGATSGRSPYTDFAAAVVYTQSSDAPVTTVAPDRYLTMGDAAEQLGAPKSGFQGFVLGAPQKST